jgi:sugar/nucleoside kinase (ribokinase family)
MLDPAAAQRECVDASVLGDAADRLIAMGAPIVALKLGADGLYLKTTSDPAQLAALDLLGHGDQWVGRELLAPCFQVDVVGTTGSGDTTIAGLLAGILRGQDPVESLTTAVAVGACNCEAADATSGVLGWEATQQRLAHRWPRLETSVDLPGWRWEADAGIWIAPQA